MIHDLTARLDRAGIAYSLRPLPEPSGDRPADLILSVAAAARPAAAAALAAAGLKRCALLPAPAGREDWLGLDQGELFLVHVAAGDAASPPVPPLPRRLPGQAPVVALIGADGAGKSHISRELNRWLQSRLAVLPLYLGGGDGPGTVWRTLLRSGYALVRRVRARGRQRRTIAWQRTRNQLQGHERAPWYLALPQVLVAMTLVHERRGKLRRAAAAAGQGQVVICDRYPQSQALGHDDGPLLSQWLHSRCRLLSHLARWELRFYQTVTAPDLVIRLVVSAETAARRAADISAAEAGRRLATVLGLTFPPTTRVVDIDAESPADQVLLAVKQAVWRQL